MRDSPDQTSKAVRTPPGGLTRRRFLGGTIVAMGGALPLKVWGAAGLRLNVAPGAAHAALTIETAAQTGRVLWYVSTTDRAPARRDLQSGRGAVSFGALDLSPLPVMGPGPEGLAPETDHTLFATLSGGTGDIATASFRTAGRSDAPPRLAAPSLEVIDARRLRAGVRAGPGEGEIHWVLTPPGQSPSAERVLAGEDAGGAPALASRAQVVEGGETLSVDFTQVEPTGDYVAHAVLRDRAGRVSPVISSASASPADVTGPVVSSVEVLPVAHDAVVVRFNTDTAEGAAHVLLRPKDAPAPETVAILAERAQPVVRFGPQDVTIRGLLGQTAYQAYVIHRDGAGNASAIGTAPVSAVTPRAGAIADFHVRGRRDGAVLTDLTMEERAAGPAGARDAILLGSVAAGQGGLRALYRTPGNGITLNAGPNVLRAAFRAVAAPGALWLRLRIGDITGGPGLLAFNVTDDDTPQRFRAASDRGWSTVGINRLDGGWFAVEAWFEMANDADRKGRLIMNFSNRRGGTQLPGGPAGAYQLAIHALTLSSE